MNLNDTVDIHDPQQLNDLTEEQLDRLPFGAIRVNAEGVILFYSRSQAEITHREPAAVLGRNFFAEVAPCTVVPEFYGRFRRGALIGTLSTTFEFVFDFEMQPVQVRITMHNAERPGEFWILAEPLHRLPPRDHEATQALITDKFDTPATSLSTTSFDFSRCDREPIATCGAIQPFGCLLVLDPRTLVIEACSANTDMYLGRDAATLLGSPLDEVLMAAEEDGPPRDALTADDLDPVHCPALFVARSIAGLPLDGRPHRWRGRLLLEIEPHGAMAMDARLNRFNIAAYQRRLDQCHDLVELCQLAVDQFRALTGFERVLTYRFEPDDHGIVIAESLLDGAWPSVLGLHYPATDIPRQARALLRETPLRYTPSRDHSDIPLLSRHHAVAEIDIGIAQLRAPSPIHRNYLQRFDVNGSLSLSLLVDDRLWGLMIFHHRAPHPVTTQVRQRLTELSWSLSARLALLLERERNRASAAGMANVNTLVGEIDLEIPFPENFAGKERRLRELVDADLVQIFHLGTPLFPHQHLGLTPDELSALLDFLKTRPQPLWSTDCLSGEFEPAARYPERIAGVMVVFVDDRGDDLLLFVRRRVRQTVPWGADPASLPFAGTEAGRLLGWPNRVFQTWQEERTHHALPWSEVAIATGLALKNLIQQVIVANASHFQRLSEVLASQRDQLHQSREEMRHRALHDALTGLPNRTHFREALDEAIQGCQTKGQRFGVALMDIDHFKTINDTLGHDRGDSLLRGVARGIRAALPEETLVARLGGDEFALLLRPTDRDFFDLALGVVEHLRQPIVIDDDRFTITCSLGLTIATGDEDASQLLKQADLALYRAKAEGRNCACPFDSRLETEVLQRAAIDRAVLNRSPKHAIEIQLQPQIAITAHSRERRFEVLARWRRDDGVLLMPGDFIPAAERNGLIRAVTSAVVDKAIALLAEHRALNETGLRFGINLSAADLETRTFAYRLIEDLHDAGVPPESIEIEITESMLLRMTPSVKASLMALVGTGIRLSLDDFGTGFSSMAYLRELPIASLKIDRMFVSGIESRHDRNLVAGMIAMAHSLGKEAIAEGVETSRQLELLRELGCDWGQGYFWSPPQPPAQALSLRF